LNYFRPRITLKGVRRGHKMLSDEVLEPRRIRRQRKLSSPLLR